MNQTTATNALSAAPGVVALLRWLCEPGPGEHQWPPAATIHAHLAAITDANLLGVLAGRILKQPQTAFSRATTTLLTNVMRGNRHRARVHAEHAVQALGALDDAGIRAAVLNGLAYATTVYPDCGTRPFTDIDILVAADQQPTALTVLARLGYTTPGRSSGSRRMRTDDDLVPTITIDLTSRCDHTADPDEIGRALARANAATGIDELRILDSMDATLHAVARVVSRRWLNLADVLRLSVATNLGAIDTSPYPQTADGWTVLRGHWPHLPELIGATGKDPEHGP